MLRKNLDYFSDILYFYLTQIKTAVPISTVPTRPKTEAAIQISFVSTLQISRLLFKYTLSIPNTNQDYCLDILYSHQAKDKDYYSSILCFYLAKIRTAIQISSVSNKQN